MKHQSTCGNLYIVNTCKYSNKIGRYFGCLELNSINKDGELFSTLKTSFRNIMYLTKVNINIISKNISVKMTKKRAE